MTRENIRNIYIRNLFNFWETEDGTRVCFLLQIYYTIMLPILILLGCKGREDQDFFEEDGGGIISGKPRVADYYSGGKDWREVCINKRGTKYIYYKNGY